MIQYPSQLNMITWRPSDHKHAQVGCYIPSLQCVMGRSYVGETTRRRSLEAKAGSQTETRQTTGGEGLDDSVGKGTCCPEFNPQDPHGGKRADSHSRHTVVKMFTTFI